MPKEIKNIKFTNTKLITAVDSNDIPDDACVDGSKNIDLNQVGKLSGTKAAFTVYNSASDYDTATTAWLPKSDGTYDIIYTKSSNSYLKTIADFFSYSNTPTTLLSSAYAFTDWKAHNERTLLAGGTSQDPEEVYYKKNQLPIVVTTIAATPANPTYSLKFDASNASATTTQYIKFKGTSSTQVQTTDWTESSVVVSGQNYLRATTISGTPYSSLQVGDSITFSGTLTERGGWDYNIGDYIDVETNLNGEYEILEASGTYITLNLHYDSGTLTDGIITLSNNITSFDVDTSSSFTSPTNVPIVLGTWHDLLNSTKMYIGDTSGIFNGDIYGISFTASVSGITAETATLDNYWLDGSSNETTVTADISFNKVDDNTVPNFDKEKSYSIGYSLLYDGEESTIRRIRVISPTVNQQEMKIKVTIPDVSYLSKRVTGIVFYGAEGSNLTDRGAYRLIEELKLASGFWISSSPDVYTQITTTGSWSETYSSRTGVSDTLDTTMVDYEFMDELNGYLYVANATNDSFDDSLYMFRSQLNAWNTFDWTQDLLRLPEVPTAMKAIGGRLWVFSANNIYKVNPNLYIEDIIEGIGCSGQQKIVVTDYGIFWHDKGGAYMTDGNKIQTISEPIKDVFPTVMYNVVFDANEKCVLYAYADGGDINIYAYYPLRQAWMFLDVQLSRTSKTYYKIFSGSDGYTYVSYLYNSVIYIDKIFGAAFDNPYTFISKPFELGSRSQNKKFYRLFTDANGTPSIKYSLDGGSYTSLTTVSGVALLQSGSDWLEGKAISFSLDDSTVDVSEMELIFRRLRAKFAK